MTEAVIRLFRGVAARPSASMVATDWLRLTLDHASGSMHGLILKGSLQGRPLHTLTAVDLFALMRECQSDRPSLRLLANWMERSRRQPPKPPAGDGGMSATEALAVLGLPPGAAGEQVKAAHRRLIQVLHPDRGGSAWLAARVNQAKEVLLRS